MWNINFQSGFDPKTAGKAIAVHSIVETTFIRYEECPFKNKVLYISYYISASEDVK
jgi:hypothetical protein